MSLSDPIVLVRVEQFHGLLTVFAWGAKVTFRAGDTSFSVNCFDPLPRLHLLTREAEEQMAAYFVPGREFLIELTLYDAADGHVATVLEKPEPFYLRELAELDWEVQGVTTSEVDDERVLIDCGVPMLAFWNGDPVPKGTYARWTGEIRAYIVKDEFDDENEDQDEFDDENEDQDDVDDEHEDQDDVDDEHENDSER